MGWLCLDDLKSTSIFTSGVHTHITVQVFGIEDGEDGGDGGGDGGGDDGGGWVVFR